MNDLARWYEANKVRIQADADQVNAALADPEVKAILDFAERRYEADNGYRGPGPDVEPDRCELDLPDGGVCLARLRADGTCWVHDSN